MVIGFLPIPKGKDRTIAVTLTLTHMAGARKDTDTEEFQQFKRTLLHEAIANILLPLKPFVSTPNVVRCPDQYFRCVLYGLGPHISDYPEQVTISWILTNWCSTYVRSLLAPRKHLLNPQRCHAPPHALDTPSRMQTADHTAVLVSMHPEDTLRERYGIAPCAKVGRFSHRT